MSERREALLADFQTRIEQFYGLEGAPDVNEFVREGDVDSREVLLVRESDEELELALVLPPLPERDQALSVDTWLQLLEGVSHFVYIVERARMGLPATQLELELQAEVDKFVLVWTGPERSDSILSARTLHAQLFEHVEFLHSPETELGERYRLANRLAARFIARTVSYARKDVGRVHHALRQFYRAGQADKIRLAQAA